MINIDEIRGALARGYCAEGNTHKIMDPVLCEAQANELMAALDGSTPDNVEEIDYTAKPHLIGSLCGDNASKWADAFCQMRAKHGFPIDQDNMMGWFANAIEIAHDKRTAETPT